MNKKLLTIFLEHKIFWLYISMEYILIVDVLQTGNQASYEKSYIVIGLTKYILVCSSENRLCLQIWYRKSPPESRSITKYRFSLS